MREFIGKVHKIFKRLPVDAHWRVFAIDGYAVLAEVTVRRILPEPRLSAERYGDGAQVAFVPCAETLVPEFILMLRRAYWTGRER